MSGGPIGNHLNQDLDMAANVTTTLSLSFAATTSSSSSSKRFVSFSSLPYPSFSLRNSKPKALVNGQTTILQQQQPNDVVSDPTEQQQPLKLLNATELYVCNLPRTYDTQHLLNIFTPHGTVLSAQVCRNEETGQSKGSAYVKMGSYHAAKNAAAALDGLDVEGREMRVKFSVQMNIKKNFVETLNTTPIRTMFYEGPHKVYVGNLSKSVTPGDVRHLFGKFGNVASVRVLQDLKQGQSRVFAFVSYLSQTERDAAMSLTGTEFCGRILVVRRGAEQTRT